MPGKFLKCSIICYFIEPFRTPFVNRRIGKQLEELDTRKEFADIRTLSDKDIKLYIEMEWDRAKGLDDKISKLTASLSVALTIGGVVAKLIVDDMPYSLIKAIILFLLFLSMLSFLVGALIGFNGLRPKPRFGYGAKYLNIISANRHEARLEMNRAASGFQVVNLIRANEASAAIDLIRNGIILFAIAIALSLVAPMKKPINNDCIPLLRFEYINL